MVNIFYFSFILPIVATIAIFFNHQLKIKQISYFLTLIVVVYLFYLVYIFTELTSNDFIVFNLFKLSIPFVNKLIINKLDILSILFINSFILILIVKFIILKHGKASYLNIILCLLLNFLIFFSISSTNLLSLIFSLELILIISIYIMNNIINNKNSLLLIIKINLFNLTFVFFGLFLIYRYTGSFYYGDILLHLSKKTDNLEFFELIKIIFIIYFLLKLFIFNLIEQKDFVSQNLLINIVNKTYFYLFIKLFVNLFSLQNNSYSSEYILYFSIIILIIYSFLILKQNQFDKFITQHNNIGLALMLLGFYLYNLQAISALLIYFFLDFIIKFFLTVSNIYLKNYYGNFTINNLASLYYKNKIFSLIFSMFILIIIGLPPFISFWDQLLFLSSAISFDKYLIFFCFIIVNCLLAVKFITIISLLFNEKNLNHKMINNLYVSNQRIILFVLASCLLIFILLSSNLSLINNFITNNTIALFRIEKYLTALLQ